MRRPSSPSCAPRSSSPPPGWLSDEEHAHTHADPPLPSPPAPLSPSSLPLHSLPSCRTSPPSPPSPRLPPVPSRPDAPLPSPYAHTHPSLRTPHASTAAEESFAPPRPPARASPPPRLPSARAKPIGLLVGALALLVLASTLWSALGLRPAVPSRPPPHDWAMPPDGEAPPLYSRVSEELLLWQLVRAFLAAPWLLPDAGRTRTLRPPPPGGWAVAVEEGEEEEEGEAVEIADSASLLLTRRMKRPAPYAWEERGGAYGGQEEAGGANEEWGWGGGEGRAWGGGEGRTPGGRLEEGEVPAVDGAAGGEDASFGEEVEAVGEAGEEAAAGGGGESGAEREPGEAAADVGGESDAAGGEEYLRVVDSGVEVAILYKGPSGSSGGRYLSLCSGESPPWASRHSTRPSDAAAVLPGDWLCASAWHSHRDESRFRRLDAVPLGEPLQADEALVPPAVTQPSPSPTRFHSPPPLCSPPPSITPPSSLTAPPSFTPPPSLTPPPPLTPPPSLAPSPSLAPPPSLAPQLSLTSSPAHTPPAFSTAPPPSLSSAPSLTTPPSHTLHPSLMPPPSLISSPSFTPPLSLPPAHSDSPLPSLASPPSLPLAASAASPPSITPLPSLTSPPSLDPLPSLTTPPSRTSMAPATPPSATPPPSLIPPPSLASPPALAPHPSLVPHTPLRPPPSLTPLSALTPPPSLSPPPSISTPPSLTPPPSLSPPPPLSRIPSIRSPCPLTSPSPLSPPSSSPPSLDPPSLTPPPPIPPPPVASPPLFPPSLTPPLHSPPSLTPPPSPLSPPLPPPPPPASASTARSRRAARRLLSEDARSIAQLLRSHLRPAAAPWFALQSVANGQLLEVAPPSDPEAWVIRARGGGGGGGEGARLAGRYAQWREEGGGLRNRGSGGLLNFRGGVAVRAHGDGAAAGRPCVRHSRRTRFALVAAEARAAGGEEGCVALGVATRSREGEELPLFSVLLPSLVATIANGSRLRFEVHVGYDDDDPFWREEGNVEEARRRAAALTAGRRVTLHTAELRGMRGAPCWVWSALFNRSCAGGCEYFYQLNDDIRLLSPGWAEEFVRTLRSNAYLPNLGIVGPLDTNNPRLMTQSFTHCTHRDIFGYYYPPEFRNWYSDDWATQVYGRRNTFWRKDLEVSHELATLGPRYDVAYEDKAHLAAQVAKGRETIGAYVAKHHPQLRAFNSLLSKREMMAVVPE